MFPIGNLHEAELRYRRQQMHEALLRRHQVKLAKQARRHR